MNIPRVLVAGDRSSAGKTTVCIGLLSALRERGLEVQGFKVGLDYIDPGFHTLVSGRPSRNLDGFLMSPEVVKEIFARACSGANRGTGGSAAEVAVVEGVRGLYEGLNYADDVGSTAQVAKILDCPVVLLIDAGSITRSVAALVSGYQSFDPEVQISGVILNRIGSERHGEKAAKAVEKYCGVKVLGRIPRRSDLGISMRHLGLTTATECKERWSDFKSVLERIKKTVEQNVNLEAFLEVARSASPLRTQPAGSRVFRAERPKRRKVRVAVAFDEAFNFYYQDTLDLLALAGAELVFFSPLREKKLPAGVAAVFLGGGFPEIYAEELASNPEMQHEIKAFYERCGVIYAECGGLMYLMKTIEYGGGSFKMCGVLDGSARFTEKRVVNYVEGEFRSDCVVGRRGERFKGHEFHHSEILLEDGDAREEAGKEEAGKEEQRFAYKMLRGEGIKDGLDGLVSKNCLASFAHLHAASYTGFAENFVESVRTAGKSRSKCGGGDSNSRTPAG